MHNAMLQNRTKFPVTLVAHSHVGALLGRMVRRVQKLSGLFGGFLALGCGGPLFFTT